MYVTAPDVSQTWLTELMAADRVMTVAVESCFGGQQALGRLREEAFDIVIVQHAPPELDAVDFVEAHRSTGADDPLVVVGRQPEYHIAPLCYEVGADAYLMFEAATPRQFMWTLGRAIQWHVLARENKRLVELDRKRARLEHNEAERLLDQQRGLLDGLQELSGSTDLTPSDPAATPTAVPGDAAGVPIPLVTAYRDLLRAHVIMGSGNLCAETASLADSLAANHVSAPKLMQLHVHVLEETLHGLGGRSSRHVMARADLLVLELMAQLVERYRQPRNED